MPATIDVMNYFTRRNPQTGKLESCMPDPVRRLLQFTRPPMHSDEQAALSFYQDHGVPDNRPNRTTTWLWSLPVCCAKIDPDPLEWLNTQIELLSFTPEIAAYKLGFGLPLPRPQALPGCDASGRALPAVAAAAAAAGSASAVAAPSASVVAAVVPPRSSASAPVVSAVAAPSAAAAAAATAAAPMSVGDVRGSDFVALDAGRVAPDGTPLMLLIPEKLALAHVFYHNRGTDAFAGRLLSGREAAQGVDALERAGYQDPAFSARVSAALGISFAQGAEYQRQLAALIALRREEAERAIKDAQRTSAILWTDDERAALFALRASHPQFTWAQLAAALGAEGQRRGRLHNVWPSAPARSGPAIAHFVRRHRAAESAAAGGAGASAGASAGAP